MFIAIGCDEAGKCFAPNAMLLSTNPTTEFGVGWFARCDNAMTALCEDTCKMLNYSGFSDTIRTINSYE